ncbi:MAG: histidine phosphatase family protein [Actinomycetaceae bacterium]|nr:histidine phosphatase family protein [Actinomycetaceae bacterium]
MDDVTKIHLVRHGEVDNPTGVLYGRMPDFHLTELGNAMAHKVAHYFSGRDIRAIISSPLERARETAEPLSRMCDIDIHEDVRLIEADNKFEGINVNKNRLIFAHPKFWVWYRNPLRPSWGESYKEVVERFSSVVRELLHNVRGGEGVIVSHQLPIWLMRSFLEGRSLVHDPRRRECSLCSVTTLTFIGNQLISVTYNEPASDLLTSARDVTPGNSPAEVNAGQ